MSQHQTLLPRSTRVTLEPLHHVFFELQRPFAKGKIRLVNLSLSGLGFRRDDLERWPEPGQTVEGLLHLHGRAYPFTAKTVHVSSKIVGARFETLPPTLETAILEHFKIELSAVELTRVNPAMLKADPEGDTHWFFGPNDCEIYYVSRGPEILHFHLSFLGNYIEGGTKKPLQLGVLDSSDPQDAAESTGTIRVKGSILVRKVSSADRNALEGLRTAAKRFVLGTKVLKSDERDSLLRLLGP